MTWNAASTPPRRVLLAEALNDMLGLTQETAEEQPVGGDEVPEPEVGAWAEVSLEAAAV